MFTQQISRTERVIIVTAVKMTACTHQTRGTVRNKNVHNVRERVIAKFEVPFLQTIHCSKTNQNSRSSKSRPFSRVPVVILAAIKKSCDVPNDRAQET